MRSGSALSHSLRTRTRLLASALLGALALVLLCVFRAPAARASSAGGVTMDHTSGPAGTALQIGISLSVDPPQQYILAVTTTDPAQGGCASAQPFPGVDPITVGTQGGDTQLTWPASLGPGQYWFCASPQSGSGPTAHSFQPFTVTPTPAPTATLAPADLVSATAVVPSSGALPGSTVTIIVTAWVTPDNAPPNTVKLIPLTDANSATPISFVLAAAPAPGGFNLSVTLPQTITPGQYAFEVGDAYHVRTQLFDIASSATPTTADALIGTQRHTMPGGTSGNEGTSLIAIVLGVIALLVLAGAILVPSLLRRQRLHNAHAAARQTREETWRR